MGIDTSVIVAIPATKDGCIASPMEWTIYDERAKAFIVTAVKARIEVEFGRPEIALILEELVDREGKPLRGGKTNGKFISINESLAWTQEYLDWHNGDHSTPWDGEIYNFAEFRYLIHRFINGFPRSAFEEPSKVDPAHLANPDRTTL